MVRGVNEQTEVQTNTIKADEIVPGSIIIEHFGKMYERTYFGQVLSRANFLFNPATKWRGYLAASHSMIMIDYPYFVDSYPSGWRKSALTMAMDDDLKKMFVYECTDKEKCEWAAVIAKTWVEGRGSTDDYKKRKALRTLFGTPNYGKNARKRAENYREHKFESGGPPGLHSSPASPYKKSMICTTFAIAAWQASLEEHETEQYMGLDAIHVSPMVLEGYLAGNSNWKCYEGIVPAQTESEW